MKEEKVGKTESGQVISEKAKSYFEEGFN